MAAKRSRLARSSSSSNSIVFPDQFHDSTSVKQWLSLRPPPVPSPAILTVPVTMAAENNQPPIARHTPPVNICPAVVPETTPVDNRPSIFSISSPERDPVDRKWDELVPFGSFLQKCFYCKKKIGKTMDVFMYSNLRAFCSNECRTKYIEMEEDLQRLTLTPMMKSTKRRSGKMAAV
ncbi:hypothetical protein SOVF_022350 [Spinacia oleracea]|nr:hypothetical protein SOVF_022350 [Spinacia oleracea]